MFFIVIISELYSAASFILFENGSIQILFHQIITANIYKNLQTNLLALDQMQQSFIQSQFWNV